MTQAELDALRNEYFVLEDGSDWPSGTLSTALAQPYKARIGSMSQKLQDDLVDLMDALDGFIA
jgi:hypothetical protein